MKNAIILHGTSGSPNHFWHPYVKNELEALGYSVWVPQLPDPDNPKLENWLPFVLKNGHFDDETVIIGHSAGCPLILSVLENINVKVKLVIYVAVFFESLETSEQIDLDPILQKSYNWKTIRQNCSHSIIINSDNDPWGCDDRAGRRLFDNIGGDLIIRHGQGHMGSETYNQPYTEFPLLVQLAQLT